VKRKPNVIVFLTDQQRWDSCGLHGNPLGLTPNYDYYARRGTHMRHAFTPAPLCGPARACLQTGLYPTQSGCWCNGKPLPRDVDTLAKCFNKAGYVTAYIGKWHLSSPCRRTMEQAVQEEDRGGYQRWLGANLLEYCSDAYDCRLFDESNEEVLLPGYRADAIIDAAIRFVSGFRVRPFFLFVSLLEPHHQNNRDDYPAPEGYADQYQGKWMPPDLAALKGTAHVHLPGYWGMVRRIDEAFGRLMDALKSFHILDDTVVAFTSDHGCHFKTRNEEYKRSGHESAIRVPMMFHGAHFMNGGDRSELFSLIDLAPTLLDVAGIRIPENMAGKALVSRLRMPDAPWEDEVYIQVSSDEVGRALRTRRWKYGVRAPGVSGTEAPCANTYEEVYLYNMENDPYEIYNLVQRENHAAIRDALRSRLLRKIREVDHTAAEIIPAEVLPDGQPPLSFSP